jgi:hypothetical protein
MWIKSEIARSDLAIEIVNIDLDEDARERLTEAGVTSVPALEAENAYIVDPNEMMKQLERLRG